MKADDNDRDDDVKIITRVGKLGRERKKDGLWWRARGLFREGGFG